MSFTVQAGSNPIGPLVFDSSTNSLKVMDPNSGVYTSVGGGSMYTQALKGMGTIQSQDDEDEIRSPRVYLASKFEDYERQKRLRDYLWEKHAIVVTARWIRGGHEPSKNTPEDSMKYALEDLSDLRAADMVIMWNPKSFHGSGRGGRHVELGYALALKKTIILVGEAENVFHCLPEIIEVPDPESGAIVSSADNNTPSVKVDESYCFEIIAQTIKAQFVKRT